MRTRLIRSLHNIRSEDRGCVLTIGNFDGVHTGHQALLACVVREARARGVPAVVMTFEPHPVEFFAGPVLSVPRLTRLREKFVALREQGVDAVFIMPFKQGVAQTSSSEFVAQLQAHLAPVHIIVGDDFHFGKQRQGDVATLAAMGKAAGFSVSAMPPFEVAGERVSSTRIRHALMHGDHVLAGSLLGRPYTMMGRVRGGDQLGRQLGFKTANIFLQRRLSAVHGIYIVKMHGIGPVALNGVANVGTRPTVNGTRALLEVHLLDFDQDIYGRYVEVTFIEKVREEERYDSLAALQVNIAKDVAVAKAYFKNQDK